MIDYKLALFLSRFGWFSLQIDGVGSYIRRAHLWLDIFGYSKVWRCKNIGIASCGQNLFKIKHL